jgi:hypothetical protein
MGARLVWLTSLIMLSAGGLAAWSLTQGQDGPPSDPPRAKGRPAGPETLVPASTSLARDPSKLTPLQQQLQHSARRGADWLYRMNGPDGRFVHGYLPALKTPMEGDHYLHQVGAAFALARAARFTGEERYAARATQAVLLLLGDTTVEGKDAQAVRFTRFSPAAINRLASAGLLVAAINELPAPEKDLLEQSEQLCNYIRRQQRADGSLHFTEEPSAGEKKAAEDSDGVSLHPGPALYGLMLSQRHRPAAWKTEAVRKALAYYRAWWKANKNPAFVPWQTAAYTEAFLQTKEAAFAEFVFEMNDWLCGLQYDRIDPRRPLWYGGFPEWADGRPAETAPGVASAACAEALAEACRAARQQQDGGVRFRRYGEALERCLQFVSTLQYTDANTQHFADWYRPALLGAFHASHQDGNLRIDYNQHAVCALVQYLTHVARAN